jgi:hypothetical protein
MSRRLGIGAFATSALALALALVSSPGTARVPEEEAAKLGASLTPVGAERAGNAEGTIPAWSGGVTAPPAGWKRGDPRVDPFADDAVLFSIDASNVAEHADKLSPGQVALLQRHEGYRMDVYPTRRSCGYPDWVYAATRTNATNAELGPDRIFLAKGWHSFLFPIPKDGAEAIWNHQYAFFCEGKIEHTAVLAPTKGGDFTALRQTLIYDTEMFDPAVMNLEQAQGRSAAVLLDRTAPARLAGQVVLVHEMVNEHRRAWLYNPGQRRVRRAPTVVYDNPLAGTESLMTNDQSRMFNGIIDRFDWKLVGKRELYIPYNAFQINYGQGLRYADMFGGAYPRRDLVRYELHRVWVVEATRKPGTRHVYSKRVLYLDEDSWTAAVEDLYDEDGTLWRVMEGLVVPIAEVPTCNLEGTFSFDLPAGRYVADRVRVEEPEDDWLAGREGRLPVGVYEPDALRRKGLR